MTPFELVKQALLRPLGGHPDPNHAVFTLSDIEEAMKELPIGVISPVGPETPMGRIQRNMLKHLAKYGQWNPAKESRSKSNLIPVVTACNGLVARGFATLSEGTYYPTHNGKQEAERKHLLK